MFLVAVPKCWTRSNLETDGLFYLTALRIQPFEAPGSAVSESGSREQRAGVLRSLCGFDSVKAPQANGVAPSTSRVGLPASTQSRNCCRQAQRFVSLGDSSCSSASRQPSQMAWSLCLSPLGAKEEESRKPHTGSGAKWEWKSYRLDQAVPPTPRAV